MPDTIDMVHNFMRRKRTFEMLRHYISVLQQSLAVYIDDNVAGCFTSMPFAGVADQVSAFPRRFQLARCGGQSPDRIPSVSLFQARGKVNTEAFLRACLGSPIVLWECFRFSITNNTRKLHIPPRLKAYCSIHHARVEYKDSLPVQWWPAEQGRLF